jgi:hypothetical protein
MGFKAERHVMKDPRRTISPNVASVLQLETLHAVGLKQLARECTLIMSLDLSDGKQPCRVLSDRAMPFNMSFHSCQQPLIRLLAYADLCEWPWCFHFSASAPHAYKY